ncbi:MAG: transcription antitermination factor NusB [Bifidobacterium sp.]|jgi:N utilization substance protein B|nr:transcription antitermination factor NusB [Bifidobacterium sp.]
MARSTARKRALNTLYEADEKGQDFLSLLAERIAQPGAQTPLPDYAIEVVRGVADNRATIDRALDEHSTGWKIRRMAVVDRNILRIAAWEILRNDEVPDKVAIDEALSLARMLSDEDSLSFIHGLLSALCADKEQYLAHSETGDDDDHSDKSHNADEPSGLKHTQDTSAADVPAEEPGIGEVQEAQETEPVGLSEPAEAAESCEAAESGEQTQSIAQHAAERQNLAQSTPDDAPAAACVADRSKADTSPTAQ